MVAGLADRAQLELRRAGARDFRSSRLRNHDIITFSFPARSLDNLRDLRLVEDLFVEVSRVPQLRNRSELTTLVAPIEPHSLARSFQVMTAFGRRAGRSYAIFVKQDRDRPLHRKDVAQRVDQEIRTAFPRWRANDPAACEFWVLWNKTASINLRMTTESFKYRGEAPSDRPGALRPTVAAAVVDALDPRGGSRIVDPMCGAGTLLLEATRRFDVQLAGFDEDPDAVALASQRLGGRARIERPSGDVEFAGFDGLVANVPWGREFPLVEPQDAVAAWRAVPRCVVLVEKPAPWRQAFERSGFSVKAADRILIRGRWAQVLIAERRAR